MSVNPLKEKWQARPYSKYTNNRGETCIMCVLFDPPDDFKQCITVGVPDGRVDIAEHIADLHNRSLA